MICTEGDDTGVERERKRLLPVFVWTLEQKQDRLLSGCDRGETEPEAVENKTADGGGTTEERWPCPCPPPSLELLVPEESPLGW